MGSTRASFRGGALLGVQAASPRHETTLTSYSSGSSKAFIGSINNSFTTGATEAVATRATSAAPKSQSVRFSTASDSHPEEKIVAVFQIQQEAMATQREILRRLNRIRMHRTRPSASALSSGVNVSLSAGLDVVAVGGHQARSIRLENEEPSSASV